MFRLSSRFLSLHLCLCVLILVAGGCARLGERVQQGALPEGAPEIKAILADLAANDAALKNFKAKGAFTLESPDFAAVKKFDDGFIAFRRPADLCVIGRKYLGMAVFHLTCVGSKFLIEFPATPEEKPYYKLEGEQFKDVPFSVSPSDIAREMFLPESWDELKSKEARLTAYDAAAQTATIEVGPKRSPRRRLVVTGPPWRVVKSERLGDDGATLAVTTKVDYRDVDGIMFPAKVDASFPSEQTRMTLDMRKIWPNTQLDPALFDIKARATEAGVHPER